ncbi:MAG: SynChlorMet cassette protein ScmC [Desulfomonilaceae bacterium]
MVPLSGNGLQLKLANGQEWSLVAVEPLGFWLKQLAAALGLEAGERNSTSRLIFDTSPPWSECLSSGLRKAPSAEPDWTYHSLGFMGFWTHPLAGDIIFELSPETSPSVHVLRMRATVDVIYSQAIYAGALPLHGGLVVRNGVGVILAGPSGAGKSTCCRGIPRPWYSPCDDEVLLVIDSLGEIRVHPFPTWSNYIWRRSSQTWQIQESFLLKGIFFLNQAERDGVYSAGPVEATILVNSSAREIFNQYVSYMNPSDATRLRSRVLDLACGLAKEIPIFKLSVTRTGKFWMEIERILGLSE